MTRAIILLLLQAVLSLSANIGNTTTVSSETKVGWYSGPTERGTLSLIWSCVATIIACTWTILHLNVPQQGESPKTKVLRKAKWMAITILFPEFIFSKAVCELRLALKTLREFKETMLLQHPYGTEKTTSEVVSETSKLGWVTQKEDATIRFLYLLLGLGVPKPGHDGSSKVDGEQDVELGSAIRDSVAVSARPASHSTVRADQQTGNRSCGTDSVKISTEALRAMDPAQPAGVVDENTNAMSTQTRHTRNTTENEDLADDAREIQPQTWTLVHSYLANMGGIVYKNSGTSRGIYPRLVLTGYHLSRQYRWEATHPLKSLVLSTKEIEDKSKADWLLKTLSVLQISSLVLTVAVRGATSLPLTQLEIATVAFSIIAIITYAANWWKPKDISEPVVVPHETCGTDISREDESEPDMCLPKFDYTESFMRALKNPGLAKAEEGRILERTCVSNDFIDMDGDVPLVFILMAVSSVLFGGLHCLAWNFDFPSDVELQLWRVASITSALLPISSLGLSMFFNHMALRYTQKEMSTSVIRMTKDYMMCSEIYGKLRREAEQSSRDVSAARKQSSRTSASTESNDKLDSKQHETIQGYWNLEPHKIRWIVLTWLDSAMKALLNIRDGEDGLVCLDAMIGNLRERRNSDQWLWEELKGSEKSYFRTTHHEVNPDTQANFTENFMNALIEWADKYAIHVFGNIYYIRASRHVTFIGGVIYVLSRLIIVAIMFSSLRATPKGVYENTPWTRFLPSFS